jgi:hypothetical protein
VVVWRR